MCVKGISMYHATRIIVLWNTLLLKITSCPKLSIAALLRFRPRTDRFCVPIGEFIGSKRNPDMDYGHRPSKMIVPTERGSNISGGTKLEVVVA